MGLVRRWFQTVLGLRNWRIACSSCCIGLIRSSGSCHKSCSSPCSSFLLRLAHRTKKPFTTSYCGHDSPSSGRLPGSSEWKDTERTCRIRRVLRETGARPADRNKCKVLKHTSGTQENTQRLSRTPKDGRVKRHPVQPWTPSYPKRARQQHENSGNQLTVHGILCTVAHSPLVVVTHTPRRKRTMDTRCSTIPPTQSQTAIGVRNHNVVHRSVSRRAACSRPRQYDRHALGCPQCTHRTGSATPGRVARKSTTTKRQTRHTRRAVGAYRPRRDVTYTGQRAVDKQPHRRLTWEAQKGARRQLPRELRPPRLLVHPLLLQDELALLVLLPLFVCLQLLSG